MNNITLCKATTDDCLMINQLAEKVWNHTYAGIHSQEQLDYMFEQMYKPENLVNEIQNGQLYYIGYDGDIPIGYLCIEQKKIYLSFVNYIYYLIIKEPARGNSCLNPQYP